MYDESAPIFDDAAGLQEGSAMDVRSGSSQPIPSVDVAWTGFPCTDVSQKNPHHTSAANRSTIMDQSLRTGAVAQNLIQFYKKHGSSVKLGFCENVGGLDRPSPDADAAPSNLDIAVHRLSTDAGMWSATLAIEPSRCFLSPVSRFRFWIINVPWAQLDGVSSTAAQQRAMDTANFMAGASEAVELDDLLLDETDPCILKLYQAYRSNSSDRESTGPPACKMSKDSQYAYEKQHMQHCKQEGIEMTDLLARMPSKRVRSAFPGLLRLTQRQLEILALHGVSFPARRPGTIDVSQSYERSRVNWDKMVCASPHMQNYLLHRCRLSVGLECLHFQGIHYREQHWKLRQFPCSLLQDLGGNAFEAGL